MALLEAVEKRLLEFDPTFAQSDTKSGRAVKQDATIFSFIRGGAPDYNPESHEHAYQLHLNVERIRVPETWFQPSMVGLDSAGLGEVAGWIVNGYGDAERRRIMDVSAVVRFKKIADASLVYLCHWWLVAVTKSPSTTSPNAYSNSSFPSPAQRGWTRARKGSPTRCLARHGCLGWNARRQRGAGDQGRVRGLRLGVSQRAQMGQRGRVENCMKCCM